MQNGDVEDAADEDDDHVLICNHCQRPVDDPVRGDDGELYHRPCWADRRR